MRISKVVLSDEEVAAQMRADAPEDESAGETRAKIDAALTERRENREAVQAEYDQGRGTSFGTAVIVNQAKLYPVTEHKGPITGIYSPDKSEK